jgi:hypothetical protein
MLAAIVYLTIGSILTGLSIVFSQYKALSAALALPKILFWPWFFVIQPIFRLVATLEK